MLKSTSGASGASGASLAFAYIVLSSKKGIQKIKLCVMLASRSQVAELRAGDGNGWAAAGCRVRHGFPRVFSLQLDKMIPARKLYYGCCVYIDGMLMLVELLSARKWKWKQNESVICYGIFLFGDRCKIIGDICHIWFLNFITRLCCCCFFFFVFRGSPHAALRPLSEIICAAADVGNVIFFIAISISDFLQ